MSLRKLDDKIQEERKSRVEADSNLGAMMAKNYARICDHRKERIAEGQAILREINEIGEELEEEVGHSLEDYQNLDSRIKKLEASNSVDADRLISTLKSDNEKLRVQIGILQRCNGNQAKTITRYRKLVKRVQDSCDQGRCYAVTELLKEVL
jgi:uncharacterized protein YdcH (DUF465 family)